MKLAVFIIFCTIGVLLGFYLIGMIRSISFFFKEKRRKIKEEKEVSRINYSTELLALLAQSINLEVAKLIQSYRSLDMLYKIENLDRDVKDISSRVYESIKLNTYSSNNMIFSTDYVMTYIIENTKALLLKEIMDMQKETKGNVYTLLNYEEKNIDE